MQGCYAWNHRRQSWHTTSCLLLSFVLPSPCKRRELSSAHGQNTSSTPQAVALHFESLCNNFPPIAMVHSNATAFSFRPSTACALHTTKGNCTPKCIQLCVLIFFSWHISPKTSSPDLMVTLQRAGCPHVCLSCTDESRFTQVSYDLKRNVEISQMYCSCFQRQREKCFF